MKIMQYEALVVGTGAAGYNAACRLKELGVDVAVVTEGVMMGTSRNTGSDKQTYYKLGLGGDFADSVVQMAKDLCTRGAVDGDNALCEAALSARCFLNLCELGVAFPSNRYGEYVGYKTDHDPYARATSAGPLTSKFMTEALQKKADSLQIPVLDQLLAATVLKADDKVCGLLCFDKKTAEYVAIKAGDIVLCTGGPAGIYADSVYPECHTGSTSLALLAGAKAQNLTEWMYGLASVKPRWNVSGTYMQVLPRFVSVDENGQEYEFLSEYFEDPYKALSTVFLKGYQWPFDSGKVLDGSSVIDLLVYRECVMKKRRVYLDYRKNPFGLEEVDFEALEAEARDYLKKADACFGTPLERLEKMNHPAVELYASKGVDLYKEYLEISLCAQHNNGGIAVDCWWQSCVRGLFAAGECAGTHGISRPGGSALNAGQVGSLRAAQYIAAHPNAQIDDEAFARISQDAIREEEATLTSMLGDKDTTGARIIKAQRSMSDAAAAIRVKEQIGAYRAEVEESLKDLSGEVSISSRKQAVSFYKLRDILVTQAAVLCAMQDYAATMDGTRGSALCYDKEGSLRDGLDEIFRFKVSARMPEKQIQEVMRTEEGFVCSWRDAREIPGNDEAFETVWSNYRRHKNIV